MSRAVDIVCARDVEVYRSLDAPTLHRIRARIRDGADLMMLAKNAGLSFGTLVHAKRRVERANRRLKKRLASPASHTEVT